MQAETLLNAGPSQPESSGLEVEGMTAPCRLGFEAPAPPS